jgi:hypothetical protein
VGILRALSNRYCLDGAVAAAVGIDVDQLAREHDDHVIYTELRTNQRALAVFEALADHLPYRSWPNSSPYVDLYSFNDRDATTDEMIYDLIDKTLENVV